MEWRSKSALAGGGALTVVDVEFLGNTTGVDDDERGRECVQIKRSLFTAGIKTTCRVSRVSRVSEGLHEQSHLRTSISSKSYVVFHVCPEGRAGSKNIGSCRNKAPPVPKQSIPAAYECSSHIDISYPIIQSP
jgi:hypothetical protein